ncbi:MAG: DUF1906 domain-containing protein [Massilia sp.]
MPILKGLDTTVELTRYAKTLRETHGFDFAVRYYSHSAWKNLSLGEARALSAAGLQIGVVWETAGIKASFFNRAQGLADASAALLMASQMGQPAGSAIYFAVDYNATQADLDGPISNYFTGVNAALQVSSGAAYDIGIYGSGLACASVIGAGQASLGWLSQSTSFAGTKEYADAGSYNLIQGMPQRVVVDDGFELSIDPDFSNGARPTGLFQV